MNSDVTLMATETRHSGTAYTLQGALLAYLVLVEQVLLHIMHNEKMDMRVASLSFTGSDGVADQLECQVLEVVLVVRELLKNFFRVAFSGKNVTIVGAGHQEVVEDSTPPFLLTCSSRSSDQEDRFPSCSPGSRRDTSAR